MFNICVLIGKIINYYEDENKRSFIILETKDNILDESGKIIMQKYKCLLWKGVFKDIYNLNENILVGIKGRLSKIDDEIIIIAEIMTILGK